MSLSNLAMCIKQAQFWLKNEFEGQIVSKFDLGLLNAYKRMYFEKMSMEIRMINFWIVISVSCVTMREIL